MNKTGWVQCGKEHMCYACKGEIEKGETAWAYEIKGQQVWECEECRNGKGQAR